MNAFYQFASTFFVNSVDAYTPQLWANESLLILHENLVAAQLVYQDFSPYIAEHGDTVNTRRPAKFTAIRKDVNDSVTTQDATATNVPVVLNQLPHVSFVIRDAQASKAFKDLVTEFLAPAMLAMAKIVDQSIIGQYTSFLGNQYGQIGGLNTAANVRGYMLGVRQNMNVSQAPLTGRNLLWTPTSETAALNTDLFTQAQQVGDGGTALQNAVLGRKLGFDNYMSQLVSGVATSATNLVAGSGIVATAAAYGTTTITISGLTAAIPAGSWCTIDSRPYRVVSSTGGSTPTAITITSPGLLASAAVNAVVQCYSSGTIAADYGSHTNYLALGYAGPITITGLTNLPTPGQLVTFTTASTSATYTVIQVDSVNSAIGLDRPLDVALATSNTVNPGPAGQFNFAFHRNAIALVCRPLAMPPDGLGARAAVVNYNGLSMRALVAYNSDLQGVRVTLDMLYGVKVLDTNLGAVMLG